VHAVSFWASPIHACEGAVHADDLEPGGLPAEDLRETSCNAYGRNDEVPAKAMPDGHADG
jgi:hypothetical protein